MQLSASPPLSHHQPGMRKTCLTFLLLAVLWLSLLEDSTALPARPSSDRMIDSIILEALADKEDGPCYLDHPRQESRTHKRNSEIINSLLGIPKVINDAGKR